MAIIQVRNDQNNGIPRINIRISEGTKPQEAAIFDVFTDLAGNTGWPIPFWPNRPYTLYFNVANVNPAYGAASVMVANGGDTTVTLPTIVAPVVGEHGQIRTKGTVFIDENDQDWLLAGYLTHLLMCRIKKGEDVGPVFDEAKSYGANTLVPICNHLSPWKIDNGFKLDARESGWQDLLAQTCDLAAAKQMRLALMCFADVQYGMSNSEFQRVWAMFNEVVKGRWNIIAIGGNEAGANGFHSIDLNKPADTGGVLYSRASEGQNTPPINEYLDMAPWEPRTGPWYKSMDDAGAGIYELQNGYTGSDGQKHGPFPCPLYVAENPIFNYVSPDKWGDHRWTENADALMFGLQNGCSAAGGFFGTSQSLEGQPNNTYDAESCRQYFRGLRASFLR